MTADLDGHNRTGGIFHFNQNHTFQKTKNFIFLGMIWTYHDPTVTYLLDFSSLYWNPENSPQTGIFTIPNPCLCFSLYVHPNLGRPPIPPFVEVQLISKLFYEACSVDSRQTQPLPLMTPHRTLMKTVPESPSDRIICKHINFPKRDHARGVSDKVLSLHTSQHSLSQRRFV